MTLHPWHLWTYTHLTSLARSWPAARRAAGQVTIGASDGIRSTVYGRTSSGQPSDGGMLRAVEAGADEAHRWQQLLERIAQDVTDALWLARATTPLHPGHGPLGVLAASLPATPPRRGMPATSLRSSTAPTGPPAGRSRWTPTGNPCAGCPARPAARGCSRCAGRAGIRPPGPSCAAPAATPQGRRPSGGGLSSPHAHYPPPLRPDQGEPLMTPTPEQRIVATHALDNLDAAIESLPPACRPGATDPARCRHDPGRFQAPSGRWFCEECCSQVAPPHGEP